MRQIQNYANWMWKCNTAYSVGNCQRFLVRDKFHKYVISRPFSKRHQSASLPVADYQVKFPVAEPCAVGLRRFGMCVAFVSFLTRIWRRYFMPWRVWRRSIPVSSALISRYMRSWEILLPLYLSSHPDICCGDRSFSVSNSSASFSTWCAAIGTAALFPETGQFAGVLKHIVSVTVGIAFDFAADRWHWASYLSAEQLQYMSFFFQSQINCISLLPG